MDRRVPPKHWRGAKQHWTLHLQHLLCPNDNIDGGLRRFKPEKFNRTRFWHVYDDYGCAELHFRVRHASLHYAKPWYERNDAAWESTPAEQTSSLIPRQRRANPQNP